MLDDFLEHASLKRQVLSRLPITAPYHASHLYSSEDVDHILAGVRVPKTRYPHSGVPVVSSVTGNIVPSAGFLEVIRLAVEDCLYHSIRWDLTAGGVAVHIYSLGHETFTVCPIAASADRLRPSIESWQASSDGIAPLSSSAHVSSPTDSGAISSATASRSKIAIIGMSGRFPQAPSMDSFWDILLRGVDTHELVPTSRWNARTHVNGTEQAKNVSGTGYGCWLHEAAMFDARFFNMSPREAPQVDPAQRLALLTAAEALQHAGIVPGRTPSTQKVSLVSHLLQDLLADGVTGSCRSVLWCNQQ